jgi:hypothetical protein
MSGFAITPFLSLSHYHSQVLALYFFKFLLLYIIAVITTAIAAALEAISHYDILFNLR